MRLRLKTLKLSTSGFTAISAGQPVLLRLVDQHGLRSSIGQIALPLSMFGHSLLTANQTICHG
ncbi:hypothetical protein CEW82_10905 [Lactiplantibacillus pentosus]|nr:hypothetical protein CEW82_10905 [Lactiplantibacillus pentosus]